MKGIVKRVSVILVNVLIMIGMMTFVSVYSYTENKATEKRQIEHFQTMTVTMEHVTENYLEGEQRICDVWSHYINSENMTIQEATDFIRVSHVLKTASAHLVYLDTLSGLSTRESVKTPGDYFVSYKDNHLLDETSWIHDVGTSINISRSYTNPVNGEQSIAFCNFITLKEDGGTGAKKAVLLRVLPISELLDKWVFPQEEFENAELSIIDTNGDYIIKGYSFKNSSFF